MSHDSVLCSRIYKYMFIWASMLWLHIYTYSYIHIIRDKIKCELYCCIYTNIAVSFTLTHTHTQTGLSGKRQHIRKDVAAASGIFIAYECLDVLCVCIAGCFPLLTYIYLCIYTQITIYVWTEAVAAAKENNLFTYFQLFGTFFFISNRVCFLYFCLLYNNV